MAFGLPGPVDGFLLFGKGLNDLDTTIKIATGVAAAFLAVAALGRYELTRDAARRSLEAADREEFKHANGRYAMAAELLGAPAEATVMAGIYALEHLGLDSPSHRDAALRVLAAFVRRTSRAEPVQDPDDDPYPETGPPDLVQAALSVLVRRGEWRTGLNLSFADLKWAAMPDADLRDVDLRNAQLNVANLSRANLAGANMEWADLMSADLTGANLAGANLESTNLSGTEFSGADFTAANLTFANLNGADLTNARLTSANLLSVQLGGADLSGADLSGANLADANLMHAKLNGAVLTDANLAGVDLTIADTTGATLDRVKSHQPSEDA